MDTQTLVETLQLEQLEVNLFRGVTADNSPGRIFGGQVIAQSLLAAYETVEKRPCHSLHCYFIHPGDPTIPIIFEVDRSRDGGSFTTRRVIAIQHGHQIFNLPRRSRWKGRGSNTNPRRRPRKPGRPSRKTRRADAGYCRRELSEPAKWVDRSHPIEMRTIGGVWTPSRPWPASRCSSSGSAPRTRSAPISTCTR
jgi:acyl-CoA thioesterase-2